MRGYLSFVLVFASAVLILGFVQVTLSAGNINLSSAIAAERTYQIQMNAKEVILECIRQGALDGFKKYDEGHSDQDCIRYCQDKGVCTLPDTPPCDAILCQEKCFRITDAQAESEAGALNSVRLIDTSIFDTDSEVQIWCGALPSDFVQNEIARQMLSSKETRVCDGCFQIQNPMCNSFLRATVQPGLLPDNYRLVSVQLAPRSGSGVVGISVYCELCDVAALSYIPPGIEVNYG